MMTTHAIPKVRSLDQNDLMWQRLRELAAAIPTWGGVPVDADDWKDIMTAGLKRSRIVPNIDNDGFVQLGLHTHRLKTSEMSVLLDLISAFGAQHGVKFRDEQNEDSLAPADVAASNESGPVMDAAATQNAAASTDSEASDLADDWREVYVQALSGLRDRNDDLKTRHDQAVQMIGGVPSPREVAWMRLVFRLTAMRNKGIVSIAQFEIERNHLLKSELPPLPGDRAA